MVSYQTCTVAILSDGKRYITKMCVWYSWPGQGYRPHVCVIIVKILLQLCKRETEQACEGIGLR